LADAAELLADAATCLIIRARRTDLSRGTGRQLADTLHLTVRAAYTQAPSAAMGMADRRGAFRPAEALVSAGPTVAAAGFMAVAAEAMVADAVEFRYVLVV